MKATFNAFLSLATFDSSVTGEPWVKIMLIEDKDCSTVLSF